LFHIQNRTSEPSGTSTERVRRTSASSWSLLDHQASSPLCGSPTWTSLFGSWIFTADSVPAGTLAAWPSVTLRRFEP
jgi:hypothetical protein